MNLFYLQFKTCFNLANNNSKGWGQPFRQIHVQSYKEKHKVIVFNDLVIMLEVDNSNIK